MRNYSVLFALSAFCVSFPVLGAEIGLELDENILSPSVDVLDATLTAPEQLAIEEPLAETPTVTINFSREDFDNPLMEIRTTLGSMILELFPDEAPLAVANFIGLAEGTLPWIDPVTGIEVIRPLYDGTVFHRVISNFMIQGGGFTAELKEKPTRGPIVNESVNKLHNTRGTLAMARTNDPDSASAQFFINQRSNLRLDWSGGKEGYTVFGEVVDGMQIVDIISLSDTGTAQAQTTRGPTSFQDVPIKPVVILSISRLKP